jgi:hypothetical protein
MMPKVSSIFCSNLIRLVFGLQLSVGFASASIPKRGPADPNLFSARAGLTMDLRATTWTSAPVPTEQPDLLLILRSKENYKNGPATLTVRKDPASAENALRIRKFVLKSLREYPKFGFRIVGQSEAHLDGTHAYVLDVDSKKTLNRVRQAIVKRPEGILILSCTTPQNELAAQLECDRLMRTIKWTREI